MLFEAICSVALFLFFLLLLLDMRKPKNFPNGPTFWPILGSAISIARARKSTGMLIKGVRKIADDCYPNEKDVIGFKVGKDRVVFTLSPESLIEFYMNPDLDGRPYGPFYETRTWNLRRGILLTDEDFWKSQRRFIHKHLKEFGYARKGMREICENEAEHCLHDFRKLIESQGGKSAVVTMPNVFSVYVLNTLWLMMAGIRYTSDNKDLKKLQRLLNDLFENIDMMGALFSHFPFLQYIAPKASGYEDFVAFHNNLHEFLRNEVDNHKRHFNPSDEPRDLIEAYLKVLYSGDEDGKIDESFSELQLLAVCLDMFMAGTETTNKSMNFMFLHLTRNPSIQRRAQQEIAQVVGSQRLPQLDDRVNMPYCEAIVFEALRMFMGHTFGIAHRALRDTKLSGFDIPKDTMVVSMFSGLLFDPKVYKNPSQFDPNNFLDDNGKLSVPENFYPFGLGKHRCMGDMIAKSNLFLIATTLLQNFHFQIPQGHAVPSEIPIEGATPSVQNYQALIVPRN